MDSIVDFLLSASAKDFHDHRPPDPARFRNVRFGHLETAGREPIYLLAGEFLPAQEEAKAEWVPFATIKTDPYEQWIGGQAAGFTQNSKIQWEAAADLSSSLQSRLDALR